MLITCHLSLLMTACSESDDESSDYDNWQERNEAYFATLADSLRQQPQQWVRYKSYSLDQSSEGNATDYVYAKIISQGTGSNLQSPMFTDSVRVSYQGRLIPTGTYPQGYVFDGTAYGTYDSATNATAKMVMAASGSEVLISGWITALLHMHRGDHWRIYIPHQLGYGAQDKSNSGIPAYSTLIFDLTLVDFSPVGQVMPVWQ
ncbi:MAG: FKBP-type peptidyl-prolyl cis-trans isomerase [Prevotella sp.]|nr:FKBP-type peptidyl-prolyl cis-trans isomerase [Prevotella sp.]